MSQGDRRRPAGPRAAWLRDLRQTVALVAFLPAGAAGQDASFRTPDGHPDLQGVWNFSTATPMERPEDLAGQETLTPKDAAAWEQLLTEQLAANESEREDAPLGHASATRSASGWSTAIRFPSSERRLVIDPPNGRILRGAARGGGAGRAADPPARKARARP